jgi:hypothetical protein
MRRCIRGELEVSLRSRIYIYGAENEDLIRGRRIRYDRHRLSSPSVLDLIVMEADELAKEFVRLHGIICCVDPSLADGKEHHGEQGQGRDSSWNERSP